MSTFGQWSAKRTLKPVTWACGAEQVLAREIAREYRTSFAHLPQVTVDAAGISARELWDMVLTSASRLLVAYSAEWAADAEMLKVACEEASLLAPVLFITADPAYARKDGVHLAVLNDSRHAQVVRCVPPGKEEDLVALVGSWWPGAGLNTASEVLARCGGSLELAREACDKAVRAGLPASAVAAVCRRYPGDDYADLVVAGHRKRAVAAAADVPASETGRVLGLLSSRLTLLVLLNAARRQGMSLQDQVVKLHADAYVLRILRPYAQDYPVSREISCREVLAMAESAYRAGASHGVLEAVAALW